ncbi:facilitated trehalose transporter Tret1-like isoform X1 [Rhodnius prolixus]|uniref:facilitated trehalose transporter Tret1-like isoform X1 n=2 Tax=Rhodnius prolixus TaxID=13249 RepID=UPI003D18B881
MCKLNYFCCLDINIYNKAFIRQLLATISCNLCVMCAASSFAWMEPLTQWLKTEVNATTSDISWLASSVEFSDVVFVVPCSLLADRWGRRTVLLLIGPLCLISWALAVFTRGLIYLYIVRSIQGVILGVVFSVAPMYTAEISSSKIRGCLGANFSVMWFLGTLYTYATGHYSSYQYYIMYLAIIPLVFFITFIFMPESPHYYFMVNDNTRAASAMKWLRSGEDISKEFTVTQKAVLNDMKQKGSWVDLFATRSDRRAFYIVQIVAFVRYMSGLTAIIAFASDTFASDGDQQIKPEQFTLIMGSVLCISAFFSSFLADTVGRRRLLIYSTIGAAISNLCIAIYFFLQEKTSFNVQTIVWIKYLGVLSFCILSNIGFGQLIQTVQAEFFPTHTRCIGGAVTGITSAIFAFIHLKLYHIFIEVFGVYMNFLTFSLVSLIGAIMTIKYIPESANKSLAEVNDNIKKIIDVPLIEAV